MMKIRIARAEDAEALGLIYQRSYAKLMATAYPADVLATALPAMTVAQSAILSSGTYFVAEDDAGIAGAGGWTFSAPGTGVILPGLAHIRHFAVDPARARQGIGRLLFAHCLETARAQRVRRFECYSSLNGVTFYASCGFEEIERRSVTMGNGAAFETLHMGRAL